MLAQAIKRRLSKEENQKGFTLIELLAVIVILGIIAVIAIPMIGGIINKSKTDADLATARQLYDASRMYIMGEENGEFKKASVTLKELKTSNYIDKTLVLPSTKKTIDEDKTIIAFDDNGALKEVTIDPAPEGSVSGVYSADKVLSAEPKSEDPPAKENE